LVEYVKTRPGARELSASYVPIEGGPEGFYREMGFEPTGEVDDGEIVVRLTL
jgi:diamine N-acetyltransferase